MKEKSHFRHALLLIFLLSTAVLRANSQTAASDAAAMLALKKSLDPPESLGWSDPNPCKWTHVVCSDEDRVTRIQIGHQSLAGELPPSLQNLTELERLELQFNQISGPLPTLASLSSLEVLLLGNNHFTSIPPDFFSGMTSLTAVEIDNNPLSAWQIPESLKAATGLQNFSANSANVTGAIPDFFGAAVFPGLSLLHLTMNDLQGGIPAALSGSQIQSLWVNGQSNGVGGLLLIAGSVWCACRFWKNQKQLTRVQSPNAMVIHPRHSRSDNDSVKITVVGSSVSVGPVSESHTETGDSSIQMVEAGNMVISIQVLRNVTNNFSQRNILGQGGFGTVYKGELHDGTKIAVKRMEGGVIVGKGLNELRALEKYITAAYLGLFLP